MKIGISKCVAWCIISFWVTACSDPPPSLVGTQPLRFDLQSVSELTLVKSNPEQQDHWWVTLRNSDDQWRIASLTSDRSILDPLADEVFVNHLLDSLRTLRIDSIAPRGPLESFHLNPPLFAIRLTTHDRELE